jgi:predicted AAA+ superfamily ATPase
LAKHNSYGAIFENWCISEIYKNRFNRGLGDGLFYFRDSTGNEIDLILEKETGPLAIEIKSSTREDLKLTAGLKYWSKNQPGKQGVIIYQGKSSENSILNFDFLSWTEIDNV